jgi:predicted SAM-dependent methyltransferase
MKINLGCGSDIRNGYLNVDKIPQGQISENVYRQGDIASLDWLVEDESVEVIIAIDCLEYLPKNTVVESINNWARKLAQNGCLKILVPDCYAVACSFAKGQFSLEEYSTILLGTQENGGDNRLSVVDVATLIEILQKKTVMARVVF